MIKQKKLLLRCADDSVYIMAFILDDNHGFSRDGTPAEIEAEIQKSSGAYHPDKLPIKSWSEITDADLPEDRYFRGAWATKDGKKIEHDMKKAQEIHLDKIRERRAQILGDLDVEWMRAFGQGKTQEAETVEKKRQKLRDIPQVWSTAMKSAKSVEELKAMWPEELGEQNG